MAAHLAGVLAAHTTLVVIRQISQPGQPGNRQFIAGSYAAGLQQRGIRF